MDDTVSHFFTVKNMCLTVLVGNYNRHQRS